MTNTTDAAARSTWRDRARSVIFGSVHERTLRGPWRAVLIVGLIVAGTLISLARTPMHVWNVLWAEDGPVFVGGALSHGAASVFEGYAGYMHLVARAGAGIAVLFPLEVVPTAVTIIAALFTSLIACACFLLLESRIASVPLRFAAWVVCFALPIMGGEVVNNLANLHWYLLIAGFVAVIVRPQRLSLIVLQGIVLFVTVTSDALGLMLLPLIVVRLLVLTNWRERIPDLTYLLGAVLQLGVVIAQMLGGAPRKIGTVRPTLSEFGDLYAYRVVMGGLFGTSSPARLLEIVGITLPGLALGAVIAVIVVSVRADRDRRVAVLALALGSLGFSAVVFSLQWDGFTRTTLLDYFTGGRYVTVPTALLLLALIFAVDAGVARLHRRAVRGAVAGLALIAVLVPVAIDFRPMNIRSDGASWTQQVSDARALCAASPAGTEVTMNISPAWFGGLSLDCALVER
ncbi:hypothetical protein [Microbacterium binotii]|uniref:hypothetical protein n=1 Tax=Microbacterium binotii TaxID=462710 RepID=UPI001F3250B6|nr:hypothetical protein [Microbacterium binotii]UIN29869.1 hypothetical protein LXM64_12045 [Microbacterium binotii]